MAKDIDNFDDEELKAALAELGVDDEDLGVETKLDDQTQVEEAEEEIEEPHKTLSKEEKAILALKKQLKETKQLLKAREDEDKQRESIARKTTLAATFKEKGYDDDTAELYAKIELLDERSRIADFREENIDVLVKYPEAKKDIKWLMEMSDKAGLSVEQLCLAKYGNAEPKADRRARAAVLGELETNDAEDRSTVSARGAAQVSEGSLTAKDLKNKEFLEQASGTKMSVKDYKAYKAKFSL